MSELKTSFKRKSPFKGKKKENKKSESVKTVVFLHWPHSKPQLVWEDDFYQVTGIDPAVSTHLAIITERRYFKGVYAGAVQQLAIHLIDFSVPLKEGKSMQCVLTNQLDQNIGLYTTSHFILQEEQEVRDNTPVLEVASCLLTYFSIKLKDNKLQTLIYEVKSSLKTKAFCGPTGKDVKPWARAFVHELFKLRKDDKNLQALKLLKREQDACDVYCMIEAFFFAHNYPSHMSNEVADYLNKIATAAVEQAKIS